MTVFRVTKRGAFGDLCKKEKKMTQFAIKITVYKIYELLKYKEVECHPEYDISVQFFFLTYNLA